ncbi:uncharacterized protein RHOBADRAFT_52767 [Rhodotorula graminis WP1]|uniref:Uncharacterized protein n=1 Tax=Rhodotorula graminis (strain WP1) TaxID=578459 RepID=A0A194S8K4_RHOGW|nr:uncharacterized protein RHOBADRAFT_52767 [Rhodotorula graminis WP1]KPV75736.1 hypothetical protein RHOBADRAFT_52767 [Rhodotorula graminis WP1]
MAAAEVGYRWPALAQQAFMAGTCRAGLSISEWCSTAAADKCCGVICPNAPITGPATVIVFTAGTFFNLLLCLIWKSEAPYNLMVQLLATDGALFGLLVRTSTEQFRLSYIHAWLPPLAIMSVVPVAIAAATVELEYIHGMGFDAVAATTAAQWHNADIARSLSPPEYEETSPTRPSLIRNPTHANFKKDVTERKKSTDAERRARDQELLNKPMLPLVACGLFLFHVVAWIVIFVYVFVGFDKPSQDNCTDELPLRQYKIVLASATSAFLFFAIIFWCAFAGGLTRHMRRRNSYRKDTLLYLASLTHWRAFIGAVDPDRQGWGKPREVVRWGICLVMFFVWVAVYVSVYITMLQKFLLLGDNPFDWGQVNALANVFVPLLVDARAAFDNLDGWARADQTTAEAIKNAHTLWKYEQEQERERRKKIKASAPRHGPVETGSFDIDFSKVGSSSRRSSLNLVKRRSRLAAGYEEDDDHHRRHSPSASHRRTSAVQHDDGLEEDLVSPFSRTRRTTAAPSSRRRSSHEPLDGDSPPPPSSRRRHEPTSPSSPDDKPAHGLYRSHHDPDLTALPPLLASDLSPPSPEVARRKVAWAPSPSPHAFDTACSGGLDVNQYCNTAAETCCGLCNVVPISGPGTILANLLGTLLNMVFALRFRSETPYTLFFQMIVNDFAVISLVDRAFQGKNRMSLWHYCMVPLSACSIVPIIVACSTARLKYLHNLSTAAAVKISYGQMPLIAEAPVPAELLESRHSHTSHSLSKALKKRDQHSRPQMHRRAPSVESADPSAYQKLNQYLAITVLWATLVHIVVYAGTFIGVFGFIDNTWQSSCIDKYGLNQWRIAMGAFAAVMLVVALAFWFCLFMAMDVKFRKRKRLVDGLEMFIASLSAVFHLTALRNYFMPRGDYWLQKRRKETLRWVISFAAYLLWAIPYSIIYVKAGNDFILPGLNTWPYEQIAGAFSLLTPICIVARAFVNERDGYDGKNKAIEDARIARAEFVKSRDEFDDKNASGPRSSSRKPSHSSPARHASSLSPTRSSIRLHHRRNRSPGSDDVMMSGALGEDEAPYESPHTSTLDGHDGQPGRGPRHDTLPSSERDERRRRHRLQLHHGPAQASVSSLGDELVPPPLFSPRNRSPPSPVSPQADRSERSVPRRTASAHEASGRARPERSARAHE